VFLTIGRTTGEETYTFRNVYTNDEVVAVWFVQDKGSKHYSLEDLASVSYDVICMSDKMKD